MRFSVVLLATSISLAACGRAALDGGYDDAPAVDGAASAEAGNELDASTFDATVFDASTFDATAFDAGHPLGDAAGASSSDAADASDSGDSGHDVTCVTPVETGQACDNPLLYPYYCSTTTSTCGCVPGCGERRRTCGELDASCGPTPDGTGGLVDCGTCPAQEQCVRGQCTLVDAACVPLTCLEQNVSCGSASDGCGGILQCGSACSFWACVPSDPRCPDPHPKATGQEGCPEGLLCPVPMTTCCNGAQKCVGGHWVQQPNDCSR